MSALRRWLVVFLLASCCSGCLVSHQHKRIVRQNEPRQHVEFDSAEVAESFNSVASSDDARLAQRSQFALGIPFLVGLSRESVPSQNAFYNDQVSRCDVNRDFVITEEEVAAYLAR